MPHSNKNRQKVGRRQRSRSHARGPGALNARGMKLWKDFLDSRLVGEEHPTTGQLDSLFAQFQKKRTREAVERFRRDWARKIKRGNEGSHRILPVTQPKNSLQQTSLSSKYALPENPQQLKLLSLTIETKSNAEVAACADALFTKLQESISDEMRHSVEAVLRAIRSTAVARGGELMSEIGHQKYFRWPSTFAELGIKRLADVDWQTTGLLAVVGYHVGRSSALSASRRQSLLDVIYSTQLGPDIPRHVRMEWSLAQSSARLKKLANTIAALTRNAKRNDSLSYRLAIRQWEEDLSYLHHKYYLNGFPFVWPAS